MSLSASKISETGWVYISASFIFILSFFLRYLALAQTSFANGWDTYYYLVQLKSILTEGRMHSEEWTLLYPLLLLFNFFLNDPVLAVKVLSGFLAACFSVLIFFLTRTFSKSISFCLLVTSFTIFSPELTYFSAQWPKNLLGLVVFLGLLLSLRSENRYAIILTLLVGFFCHRMTAVLGVLVAVVYYSSRKLSVRMLLMLMVFVILITLIGFIFPGTFHLKDLERLSGFLSDAPQIPFISFYQTFGYEKIGAWWMVEFILAAILFLFLIVIFSYQLIKQKKKSSWNFILVLLFLLLWFPFYQWDLAAVSYRFFHAGVILSPLILMACLDTLKIGNPKFLLIPTIILLTISFFSWKSYQPQLHDPPFGIYQNITHRALEVLQQNAQQPQLVVAHKALAEYFSYATNIDAMFWIPEYKTDDEKLLRIAVLPFPQLYRTYMSKDPSSLRGDYFLISEKEWQEFIALLKKNESSSLVKEHLTWKNPNEQRPSYLRKDNSQNVNNK